MTKADFFKTPELLHLIEEDYYKQLPVSYPSIHLTIFKEGEIPGSHGRIVGRGIDWNKDLARVKSCMEAIERSVAYSRPASSICWASMDELGIAALGSNLGVKGKAYPRWWCQADLVGSDEIRWVPIEYTQLSSACTVVDPVVQMDSTGLAVHFTKQDARRHALAEVLEREGVFHLWHSKIITTYKIGGLCASLDWLLHVLEENGYRISILTFSPIAKFTSCCAIVIKNNATDNGPALVAGSGGDWDVLCAIEKACLEAFTQLVNAIEFTNIDGNENPNPFSPYDDYEYAEEMLRCWGVSDAQEQMIKVPNAEHEQDVWPSTELAKRVLTINRETSLTTNLGLAAVQVIVLDCKKLMKAENGYCGKPSPFQ